MRNDMDICGYLPWISVQVSQSPPTDHTMRISAQGSNSEAPVRIPVIVYQNHTIIHILWGRGGGRELFESLNHIATDSVSSVHV